MKKQLSIRLEETDILKLKIYALKHQITLQTLIESYLLELIKGDPEKDLPK